MSKEIAIKMLEYCRFIYKAYAQSCVNPLDPFYESYQGIDWDISQGDARDRLCLATHSKLNTKPVPQDLAKVDYTTNWKFDPIWYRLNEVPNPYQSVMYRDSEKDEYVLFLPRSIDKSIASCAASDLTGRVMTAPVLSSAKDGVRCCYFQGKTGATAKNPDLGWQSLLGAVLYDPKTEECVIVFRGSRSGWATRSVATCRDGRKGSPDWITDLESADRTKTFATDKALLPGRKPLTPGEKAGSANPTVSATVLAGFALAYESCQTSLVAAYKDATKGSTPKALYVTGHSLGGALAQWAYFDLMAGVSATDNTKPSDLRTLVESCPRIFCYPISAPGILAAKLAAGEAWMVNFRGAVQDGSIEHYFHQADIVHGGPLVIPKGAVNIIASTYHENTVTFCHIGAEYPLDGNEASDLSHEPLVVWNKLNNKADDTYYWHKVKVLDWLSGKATGLATPNPVGEGPFVGAPIKANEYAAILADSINTADGGPLASAQLWAAVSYDAKLGSDGKSLPKPEYAKALDAHLQRALVFHAMYQQNQGTELVQKKNDVFALYQEVTSLLAKEKAAKSSSNPLVQTSWRQFRGTASAYWSLATYLAALLTVLNNRT